MPILFKLVENVRRKSCERHGGIFIAPSSRALIFDQLLRGLPRSVMKKRSPAVCTLCKMLRASGDYDGYDLRAIELQQPNRLAQTSGEAGARESQ